MLDAQLADGCVATYTAFADFLYPEAELRLGVESRHDRYLPTASNVRGTNPITNQASTPLGRNRQLITQHNTTHFPLHPPLPSASHRIPPLPSLLTLSHSPVLLHNLTPTPPYPAHNIPQHPTSHVRPTSRPRPQPQPPCLLLPRPVSACQPTYPERSQHSLEIEPKRGGRCNAETVGRESGVQWSGVGNDMAWRGVAWRAWTVGE
jgi:hypothetical protein